MTCHAGVGIRLAIWLLACSEAEAYARAGALLARLEEATAPIYDASPAFITSELDEAERGVLQEVLPGLAKEMGEKLRSLPDMGSVEAYEIMMLWFVQRKRGF